jgi:hypothetical protein
MLTSRSNHVSAGPTGVFWDPFDVAPVITALIRVGFSEYEIDTIGVLCGPVPDLTEMLFSIGMEKDEASFYNDCLAEGAMLLIVRTQPGRRAAIALNTLVRYGAIVPAAKNPGNTGNAALSAEQ